MSARWRSGRRRSAPTIRIRRRASITSRGCFSVQGDLAGGAAAFERALAIREKALGPDHPYTATSLNNLAGLLQAGRTAGGAAALERALAIRERRSAPTIPRPQQCETILLTCFRSQGNWDQSHSAGAVHDPLNLHSAPFAAARGWDAAVIQSGGDLAASLPPSP